jgi:hypothetical protein
LLSTILQLIIAIYNSHYKDFSYCQQSESLRHEIIAMAISEQTYTDVISLLISLSVAEISILINTTVIFSSELASVRRFSKAAKSNLSAGSTTYS